MYGSRPKPNWHFVPHEDDPEQEELDFACPSLGILIEYDVRVVCAPDRKYVGKVVAKVMEDVGIYNIYVNYTQGEVVGTFRGSDELRMMRIFENSLLCEVDEDHIATVKYTKLEKDG